MRLIPLVVLSILPLASCDLPLSEDCNDSWPPDQEDRATIQQGVWGVVWYWEGDFMPGDCPSGTVEGVSRTIYVYAPTGLDQVTNAHQHPDGFYTGVHTQLVDSVRSDGRGFFQIALPAGRYSLFVREDDLLYANHHDTHIQPVDIPAAGVVRKQVDITYRRTW